MVGQLFHRAGCWRPSEKVPRPVLCGALLLRSWQYNRHSNGAPQCRRIAARLGAGGINRLQRRQKISHLICPNDVPVIGILGTEAQGIVKLSGRGMLVVSVARQLGLGNSFARLLCCPAQAERGRKKALWVR